MKRRGAYILLLRLAQDDEIAVGRLGAFRFRRGEYAYVGSAMGGLDARVARHLRAEKRRHWHIDYLLERASVSGVLEFESPTRIECDLSDALASSEASTTPVRQFGSSDCLCLSHLHYFQGCEQVAEVVAKAVGRTPRITLESVSGTGNPNPGAARAPAR